MSNDADKNQSHDFVIVGSGAGGGPLAANLALAGHNVLLIEAGADEAGGGKFSDNYSIPAFHPFSTEDPKFSWEFFVRHYSRNQTRDEKYHPESYYRKDIPPTKEEEPGIFYPRASALGGCTAHHAMITVYPADSDWDNIAQITGDSSWRAQNMRKYFDRIEHAQYRDGSQLLKFLQPPADVLHRFWNFVTANDEGEAARGPRGAGWLTVSQADPLTLAKDIFGVARIVLAGIATAAAEGLAPMPRLNPNDPRVAAEKMEGINVIPISVNNGRRMGARERVLQAKRILEDQAAQGAKVGRLDIALNTFAKCVEFDPNDKGPFPKAIGVRCSPGEALYKARHHDRQEGEAGVDIVYRAEKEVILCGGAFNTPQLLMLSGIGPAAQLKEKGVELRVPLEGVGKNLQDRYEVGVVAEADKPFRLLEEATFTARKNITDPDPDPVYTEWREGGHGIYGTNGVVLGIIKRSSTCAPADPPDLFIFGIPGYFRGYEVGYSKKVFNQRTSFTWAVLKGHTANRSGEVKLKTNHPFDTPDIHFHYFEESHEAYDRDVRSVVDGVRFAEKINDSLPAHGVIIKQVAPQRGEDLYQFVKDNAWGHHASCTCMIGADNDELAVLDKDFRVRGVRNLRVVDASVFPRIPGLFILSSVYMISEKASDVIIDQYRR